MTNLNKLLKQAQKMQEQVQQEMSSLEVEESSGGGMVTARVNGHKLLLRITVDQTLLAPSEKEMLEDLIVAAVNGASNKVDEALQQKLGGLAGGMCLPGM